MRILYVHPDWRMAAMRQSGSTIHVKEICKGFVRAGHEVCIVAGRRGEWIAEGADMPEVVELRPRLPMRFKVPRRRVAEKSDSVRAKNTTSRMREPDERGIAMVGTLLLDVAAIGFDRLFDLYFYLRLKRLANKLQPDAIYERFARESRAGSRLARKLGVPSIIEVNGSRTFESEWRRSHSTLYVQWIQRRERKALGQADHVLVVSRTLERYLLARGVSKHKVELITNGVDIAAFENTEHEAAGIRNDLGLAGKVVIGFAGTFNPWIDFITLISVVSELAQRQQNLHLLLVGDGEQMPLVRQAIEESSLKTSATLTGYVPHARMPAYLKAMDIAVAPYREVTEFHFSPLKIFEYMASGAAILAADYPGIADVIAHGRTGLLFAPGNADAMKEHLQALLVDESLRRRLGQAGYQLAEQEFTWQRKAEEIVSLMGASPGAGTGEG